MGKANAKIKLNEDYYLRYGTNAMVEFEDATGEEFLVVATKMERGAVSFKMLRSLVWAGLLDCDEDIKQKEAGNLVDEVGFERTVEKVGQAIEAAFPSSKEEQAKNLKKVASQ